MTGSTLFDVDATIVSSLLDQTSLGLALKVRLFAILAAAILAAAALARHSAGWFLQAMAVQSHLGHWLGLATGRRRMVLEDGYIWSQT
jgi:hypothetical protein